MNVQGEIPDQIGAYRVLRPIARGGMAEVYEVEDPPTGEHFALKLLMEAGTARKRFDREYEAMTRLNHPNIVRVYNYGFQGPRPWMTMELLGGLTVQAYAKRIGRPGTPERIAEVIRVTHDIARALDHIHRRGLIHRDLKSDNVLVLPDGRVKLLDFGAAHLRDALEAITRDGEFLGTFAYASPEQFLGRGIDHRSDLYSLGVLLYRLATGRRPFWSKDHHQLARMHVTKRPRAPRELTPSLPEELERIILWLLEKKPTKRAQSGSEVADALEELAGETLYLPGTLDVSASAGALVGREEQVRQVRVFLDEGEPGGLAAVLGMAGSGRQTVMDMVRDEAEKREREVWDCWGRQGQGVLPLVEMMSSVADTVQLSLPQLDRVREDVQRILDRGLLPSAEEREAFYRGCATMLRARIAAHGQDIVILVWNLHEMGPETMTALAIIREACARTRTQLLVVADADDAAGSLEEQGLGKLGEIERVALPPLEVHEVSVLVGALLHRRPPPAALARRIHVASGGLPDFVNEVLASLVKQGFLRVKGEDANRIAWGQREDLSIPVSAAARTAIEEDLLLLPAAGVRLLEALSLVGGEAALDVLAWALERTVPEVGPVLDVLAERGLLRVSSPDEGAPSAIWRHELVGEVVLEQLHPCRRDVLGRRLMDVLEDAPTSPAQVRILLDKGRVDEAIGRAVAWGDANLAANRPVRALAVLDPVVLRADEAVEVSGAELARLFLSHTACVLMARPSDRAAERSLERAEAHLHGSAELVARHALLRARQQRAIGQYGAFRRLLAAAWQAVDKAAQPAFAAEIAYDLGLSERTRGAVKEAGSWVRRAWTLAEGSGSEQAMATAQVGLASWMLARGETLEAERMADSSRAYFDERGDTRGLSLALPVWVDVLRLQGRWSEALGRLRDLLPVLKAGEAPSFYVRLALAKAWCETDLRRLGRAQETVEELMATLRKGEHLHLQLGAELVSGRVALESGQHDEAKETLVRVVARARAAELGALAEHALGLLAENQAAMGEWRRARGTFREALAAAQASGDMATLVAVCVARVRALAAREDPRPIYGQLSAWIRENRAHAVQLEFLIGTARHLQARGGDAAPEWRKAQKLLDLVTERLEDTDRAVFRVHPWTRAILRGQAQVKSSWS